MKYQKVAKKDGWAVFSTDDFIDGPLQICRLDDPNNTDIPRAPNIVLLPAFANDEQAVRYVIAQAKAGDEACIRALSDTIDNDELVRKLLWCDAFSWKL